MFKQTMIALAGATAIGIGFAESAQADPILIDDFSVEQDVGLQPINGFIPANSQVGPDSTILGGFRDTEAQGNANVLLGTRLEVTGGGLNFSNSAGTTGRGLLTWDGDDDPTVLDPTGFGGIDITQNNGHGLSGIFVDIASTDLAGLELGFTIFDLDNNVSTLSRTFASAVASPLTTSFLFEDFSGPADFTNVGAIKLEIGGPEAIDARLANIRIDKEDVVDIPEPMTSAMALLAVSVVSGLSLKRRQIA